MSETTTVAFPGLGIDSFTLNKIAFTVGKFEVRWYGVIITLGIALAFFYAIWRGKRNENIIADDIIDVGIVTVFLGVIGARLYYVLTTLDVYNYDSFYDVIAIWEGGLAIYGGIIGGCLGILLVCAIKKMSWRKLFDMIAPGVVIAQALGRWGNFFNGEAYGYSISETTRFYFFNTEHVLQSGEGTLFHALRMQLGRAGYCFHPTFFYESLWNVLGFVLLNIFYKRKKFDGQIALMYFMWYGFGRMFIEGFRTDSLYIPGTTLRISQCLGLTCFAVGAILLTVFLILAYKKKEATPVVTESAAVELTDTTAETDTVEQSGSSAENERENIQLQQEDEDNGKVD